MFIHPLHSNTKISNLTEDCIQPNAVDLKISRLFRCLGRATIHVDNVIHREVEDLSVYKMFELDPLTYYQFETEHHVEVGEGEIAWLVHRSSLARNGLIITSGVYDAGFRGKIGGVIFNAGSSPAHIEIGARVCQILIAKSQSIKSYDGQYQDSGVVE